MNEQYLISLEMRDHLSQVLVRSGYCRARPLRIQTIHYAQIVRTPWNDLLLLYCCHLNNIHISIYRSKASESEHKSAQLKRNQKNVNTKVISIWICWSVSRNSHRQLMTESFNMFKMQISSARHHIVKLTMNWLRYIFTNYLHRCM